MATYNWKLTSGVGISILPYGSGGGLTIASSPDSVKPSNVAYVAIWGNDATGNGSRLYPYRSISRAGTNYGTVIVGTGVYREGNLGNLTIVADGNVLLDGTGYSYIGSAITAKGIKFKNFQAMTFSYCLADSCTFSEMGGDNAAQSAMYYNCTFIRINGLLGIQRSSTGETQNNTYIQCYDVRIAGFATYSLWKNIFYQSNLTFSSATAPSISYSLFYQCNYRFAAPASTPSVKYPSVPSGYSQLNSLSELISASTTGYPTSIFNFPNCYVGDPLFNNAPIDDYSLAFLSPAKNLSYFGTYVGANCISTKINAAATETAGGFHFASKVNLNIANDSITVIDPSLEASVNTKVIPNLTQRELQRALMFGFNADRNGKYVDSTADLATVTIAPGTALAVSTPYLVEVAAITYNGITYQPGSRFTTSTVTAFTSASGGVCREILEASGRNTLLARFSDGGAAVAAGEALVVGNWYYVTGTVTYNSVDYTNTVFYAADTNTFSGTGSVIVAMTNKTWNHFEFGAKFSSNNVGDARLGDIVRGNGDPDYVRGTGKEFPINARFIQLRFIFQPNNLKP
ncbi:hypothetical protein [Pedobacter sp. MW01-1-1]|uniref:hypothetical protein n=1 Tax=Pedobacter sp. MW01-1-1 TaxID=3383027 RepID=UPI003FEDD256